MGPQGPLPWKVMCHIMKSWDNVTQAQNKSEGLVVGYENGHSSVKQCRPTGGCTAMIAILVTFSKSFNKISEENGNDKVILFFLGLNVSCHLSVKLRQSVIPSHCS